MTPKAKPVMHLFDHMTTINTYVKRITDLKISLTIKSINLSIYKIKDGPKSYNLYYIKSSFRKR